MVSTDAMGCQKAIAQTLIDAGAEYVLALKDHPPTWCADVRPWLDTEVAGGRLPVQETVEKDPGRIEIRRHALSSRIDGLEAKTDWAGLQAVGRVESTRRIADQVSTECRYFLCSSVDQGRFAAPVRPHWGIENQPHWVLDGPFGEDACRTRRDHSAENLAVIRRMALNVLRHNSPSRDSIARLPGWQWRYTRMTDPQRAERLWLVLAIATRWALAVGGEAEAHLPDVTFPTVPGSPRQQGRRWRLVGIALRSCLKTKFLIF